MCYIEIITTRRVYMYQDEITIMYIEICTFGLLNQATTICLCIRICISITIANSRHSTYVIKTIFILTHVIHLLDR